MYLDSRGHVTVGIGHLVKTARDAQKLPFIDRATGRPATPAQIADAFAAVKGANVGGDADRYASLTGLRLPRSEIKDLALQRLDREFLPGLRRIFPGFDNYPRSAQVALCDMAYNLGIGGLAKFRDLRAACESGDFDAAARECNRKTSRDERNEWARSLFRHAAVENAARRA